MYIKINVAGGPQAALKPVYGAKIVIITNTIT